MSVLGNWLNRLSSGFVSHYSQPSKSKPDLSTLPRSVADIAYSVQEKGLTYLPTKKLAGLLSLAIEMEKRQEPGTFVEAGCALGGSAIALTSCKRHDRPFLVYDVFGMIPPPSELDGDDVHKRYEVISSGQSVGINGNRYYGYEDDLHSKVTRSFSHMGFPIESHGVSLVKGLVADTLIDDQPVSLAHIDVDWYEPVTVCLERIVPRLTSHGAIVLDDYSDWSGCHSATNDFFDRVGRDQFSFDSSAGHLVVRRAK